MFDENNKSSKLSPKPKPNYPEKKGWDDLDDWVQRTFKADRTTHNPRFGSVFIEDYSMTKSEIVFELKKIGLKVEDGGPGFITVRE